MSILRLSLLLALDERTDETPLSSASDGFEDSLIGDLVSI
jgi:hypothetical protein